MRTNILFAAIGMLIVTQAIAQNETAQEVNTPVHSVIVYLSGAEVTQSKAVSLNAGRNKVTFTGLSSKLIPKSIQATASGGVTILAVSDQVNYMATQTESARVKQLKDSVTMFNESIARTRADRDAYENEKNMILSNKEIGGTDKGVSIAELKLAADFYRSRLKEINAEMLRLDLKLAQLGESLTKSNRQLTELNAKAPQPTAEVTVLISANAKISSTIELHYLVANAGWQPSYDLRAEDIDKPIELTYRAKVFNNTGVDWNDVKVKLSTADPNKSASKPDLDMWNLDYNANQGYYGSPSGNYNQNNRSMNAEGYLNQAPVTSESLYELDKKQPMQKQVQVQYEQIQVSELSAEFDIKNNYTIPADSKPYIVEVTTYNLPASYQHFCIPKVDRDAFLLARITGWEDLDLVEGPANVYYAGTYIGQSYIATRSVDDTLALSLGRDNKVIVTRTKQKDLTSVKSIGSTKKETYAYEMIVKNNRKAPITIELQDQLPVSKQGDIEVEAIETSKGELDAATGKLKWTITLAPGETKKIALAFSIKYPKTKVIQTKRYKTMSAPSF